MDATSVGRLMTEAKARIDNQEARGSTRAGWLMITALLIESWDIYSMAYILSHLKEVFNPSPWLLGFTAAGTQFGAIIGALLGGWLTDRLGRRKVFLGSMIMFATCAILQGFAPDMMWLAVIRCFAGIPVGADVANGFTYMMEILPKGKREIMANRWQFMFACGIIGAILLVTVLEILDTPATLIWRLVLAFPAIPAIILLFLRRELPETPTWLVERGKFREARTTAKEYYGSGILDDILPDEDVQIPHATWGEAIRDLMGNEFRRKTTIFGWISCAVQSFENYAFSFYLPLILTSLGIAGMLANNTALLGINLIAAISAFVGPLMLPKLGHKGLSQWGFGLVAIGVLTAGYGVFRSNMVLIILGAAVNLWGHYWSSESGMTVVSLVARPAYRGAATGIGYTIVKIFAFSTTFIFPTVFEKLGVPLAACVIAIGPIIAFLAATFILPEMFGHSVDEEEVRKVEGLKTLQSEN